MLNELVGFILRQPPDLIAEGKNFSRFGFIVLNRFALARKFRLIDFSLAFGREIRAGAHRKRARNHAHHPRDDDEFAVAQGRSGNTGNNSEDRSETVVDSIDSVPDPAGCLWMVFLSGGQKFVEGLFGLFGSR
jgi:hypothetical protein